MPCSGEGRLEPSSNQTTVATQDPQFAIRVDLERTNASAEKGFVPWNNLVTTAQRSMNVKIFSALMLVFVLMASIPVCAPVHLVTLGTDARLTSTTVLLTLAYLGQIAQIWLTRTLTPVCPDTMVNTVRPWFADY
jgi:hypothetical protein